MNNRMRSYHERLLLILSICCFSLFASTFVYGEKQFPPWDEQVFVEVAKRHGEQASERLREVYTLILKHLNDPEADQLELINDYMNGLTWIADSDLWKQEDYWATPFETITTFGGDCEDIAIAKYAVLRLMGVLDTKFGFAYVITAQKEPHMVLIYKADPGSDAYVLDNQHKDVVSAKKRKDLVAVYAFKNDGTLYVIKDSGGGDRKILMKKEGQKFKKWQSAKTRARKNTKSYLAVNGGRPLAPEWFKAQKVDNE